MDIKLNLCFKKSKCIQLAEIKGEIEINIIGSFVSKPIIKKLFLDKIFKKLKDNGLQGEIEIDGKTYYLTDEKIPQEEKS